MVAFRFTALAVGASLLAETVLASPAASHLGLVRRDRRLALRQSAGGETYPDGEVVSCAPGLDTVSADGSCQCGPGRQQASDDTCELIPGSDPTGDYAVFNLAGPVALDIPITTSYPTSAPANVLTTRQCAAICESEAACIGFYLQPGSDLEFSKCWKIGGDGAYADPRLTGIPFTAAAMRKRADGVVGSIGAPGGVLGIDSMPTDDSSSTCVTGVDTRNADFTCTCGAGRVNDSDANTGCRTAPSAASRLRQRRRENTFEGVQW